MDRKQTVQFPPGRVIWESLHELNQWGKHTCGVSLAREVVEGSEAWQRLVEAVDNPDFLPRLKDDRMRDGYVILTASSRYPVKWLRQDGKPVAAPESIRGREVILHCTLSHTGIWLDAVRELPVVSGDFSYSAKPAEPGEVSVGADELPF